MDQYDCKVGEDGEDEDVGGTDACVGEFEGEGCEEEV